MKNQIDKNNPNWKGGKEKTICLSCGIVFSHYGRQKFCSRKCMFQVQKGNGNPNWKGGTSYKECKICKNKYKIYLSGMRKRFCSHSCRKQWLIGYFSSKLKGEKNHNWKGGVTTINEKIRKSLEYKQWRIAVFIRDKRTCQRCYTKKGKIEADHIKTFSLFPELRFNIDNGRTLCKNCHKKTSTYGEKCKRSFQLDLF